MIGPVRFSVEENGEEILIYTFGTLAEAKEIYTFIREFFPDAEFIFQPVYH